MKLLLHKIPWLISGILLTFAGIITIFNPYGTLDAIAFILGMVMFLTGILGAVIYYTTHDKILGARWVLTEAILNILIAVFLFCNPFITAKVMPYILGMWIIFTGISRLVTSIELRKESFKGWGWLGLLGLASVVLGMIFVFLPNIGAFLIGLFIGIFFFLQGAQCLFLWYCAHKLEAIAEKIFIDPVSEEIDEDSSAE